MHAHICIGQIKALTFPPPAYPGHLTPLLSLDGEFGLYPRFHVKSLGTFHCMWQAIVADVVLEDFHGRDCAFVANWLQGKS